MIAGKRYSTVTGKEITPADDFSAGYAEAVADVAAWMRKRSGTRKHMALERFYADAIERGDAKGAAGKAGGK
jgi:hypothetical protein